MLNSITYEEHDGLLNAKKVSLISGATIYAVVNTSAPGVSNSIVTVANTPLPVSFSGNVTLDAGSKTQIVDGGTQAQIYSPTTDAQSNSNGMITHPQGYVFNGSTWDRSRSFFAVGNASGLGVSAVGIVANVTLSDAKTNIGLVTLSGGTAWSDPKAYIGLATIDIGTNNTVQWKGNVTLDAGSKTQIIGNVTLADPKTFIGSVSVGGLVDSKGYIGLTTVTPGTAWPDPKTYIGLTTVDIGTNNSIQVKGNVTLSDPKTFIGSVSVGGLVDSKGFIGLVTIGGMSLVTLGDPKGYIGLVTATLVGFSSLYTSLASIVSASGLATIIIPPSGKIAVIKDLMVSSLGRSESSFWVVNSSATGIRIPWTSLSTTSGYIGNFGEAGLNVGKADDGLSINLNGAATVSWMANVKFI